MSKKTRKQCDATFKRKAFRIADQSNKSDIQIERNLGISHGTLFRWRKYFQKNPVNVFPGTGHQTALEEEVRKLRKEQETSCQEYERQDLKSKRHR